MAYIRHKIKGVYVSKSVLDGKPHFRFQYNATLIGIYWEWKWKFKDAFIDFLSKAI